MQSIRAFHTAWLAGHTAFSSQPSEEEESARQFLSVHFSVTVDHCQSTLLCAYIFTVRQRLQSKVVFKVAAILRDNLGRWSCLLQRINFVTEVSFLGSCPRKTPPVAASFLFGSVHQRLAELLLLLLLLIAATLLSGGPGRGPEME